VWRRERLVGEDLGRLIGNLEDEVQVRDTVVGRLVVLRCVRRFRLTTQNRLKRDSCLNATGDGKNLRCWTGETIHRYQESVHWMWLKFGAGGHV